MWPGIMNARPEQTAEQRRAQADAAEAGGGEPDADGGQGGRQNVGNAPRTQIDHRGGTHADRDDCGDERVRTLHWRWHPRTPS
jgi:hypothetical protein